MKKTTPTQASAPAPEQTILEWYNFHKLGYYEAALPQGI